MADKADSGIYEIVNLVNGKRYIGSAVSFYARFHAHRHHLRKGSHHCSILQNAWRKYGESSFAFNKLVICRAEDLLLYEQRSFDVLLPEYNVCRKAGSVLGVRWSEAAKARHSLIQKANPAFLGRKHSPETLAKMSASQKGVPSPMKGTKRHSDAIAKTAAAHRGRKRSAETCAKISSALTGSKKPPRSIEYRAKISAAQKDRPKSPEHMAKFQEGRANQVYTEERKSRVSESLKSAYVDGRHRRDRPPEYRAKIAKALTGKTLTPEHRANVAAAMRGKKRGPYKLDPAKADSRRSAGIRLAAAAQAKRLV